MTVFVLVAALFLVAALVFLLPPLLRQATAGSAATREESNADIYRAQLAELREDLARGQIEQSAFDAARADLEQRVAEELAGEAPATAEARPGGRLTGIAVAVLVPLVTVVAYAVLGSPQVLTGTAPVAAQAPQGGHEVTEAQIVAMVDKLSARLKTAPQDAEGWAMLARSLSVLGRFRDSADAYAKATELVPNNASLLADYADTLAMAQGRLLAGKPFELARRAIGVDPNHVKALALAGSAEFEAANYDGAVAYWERILKVTPPDSDFARSVQSSIQEARQRAGKAPGAIATAPPGGASAPAPAAPPTGAAPPAVVADSPALEGVVRLAPEFASQLPADATLFVVARAAQGPRMPLAVARAKVSDLPYRFRLDDSMAMTPNAKLSNFASVVVVARVSRAGTATPQKGDVEGSSPPLPPGTSGIEVVLANRVE